MENAQISSIVKWLSVFWSFQIHFHHRIERQLQHSALFLSKNAFERRSRSLSRCTQLWMNEERRCDSGVIHQFPWHHSCMFPILLTITQCVIRRVTRARKHVKKVNWCKCLRLRLRLTLLVWASWRSWTRPWFGSPPNSLRFHSANVSVWIVY